MSLVGLLRANTDQNETNPLPNTIAMHIVSSVPGENWSNHKTSVLLHRVGSYYFSSTFHFSHHDWPQSLYPSWYIDSLSNLGTLSTNFLLPIILSATHVYS